MSLLEKYEPKKYKDIVGNKTTYEKLLKDLEKSKYKGIYLLCGKSGLGKTAFVKILSKEKKRKIQEIKMDDIVTRGEKSEKIEDLKTIFKKSIIPKTILIDDVDLSTSVAGVRNPIESRLKILAKYINKDKRNLIFIIATENKKSIFKQYERLKTYSFKKIQDKTLLKYVTKIAKTEKIKLSEKTGEKVLTKIITNSECNIRKILMNLDMLLQGKKKIVYTEENKQLINKNKKDKTYKDIYEIMGDAFSTCDMTDPKSLDKKEKVFFADTFLIQNSVFEYYLKCENTKNTKDMDLIYEAMSSIEDGEILENSKRDCDFSLMPFICYTGYVKPTQLCGKAKTQLFFPSVVSRCNKVINHNKLLAKERGKNPGLFSYSNMDFSLVKTLQTKLKMKKTEQIIPNATLKKIYTLD